MLINVRNKIIGKRAALILIIKDSQGNCIYYPSKDSLGLSISTMRNIFWVLDMLH